MPGKTMTERAQHRLTTVLGSKTQEQSDIEKAVVSMSYFFLASSLNTVSKRKMVGAATWAGEGNGDPLQWLSFCWG